MIQVMGFDFMWRPELGNGGASSEEIAGLQKALNYAYTHKGQAVGARQPLDPGTIPVNIWVGSRQAMIAAEMPGYTTNEIEIHLSDQDLQIKGAHPGQKPVERVFTLPFLPDINSIQTRLTRGMLFIFVNRLPQ